MKRLEKKNGRFETVSLADLRQGRRGKHHEVIVSIFDQLRDIDEAHAIKIPLGGSGSVALANLRAAVIRAARARGTRVGTYSESGYLYVWRRTPSSRRYERARSSA